jgi:hypothetical protein
LLNKPQTGRVVFCKTALPLISTYVFAIEINSAVFIFFTANSVLLAGTISGTVTDEKGTPLGFASVTVKGTGKGAVANSEGRYLLSIEAGEYTLICHHVGYRTEEKKVQVQGKTCRLISGCNRKNWRCLKSS